MWPNPQFAVDLVTFTEEILNGNLHFLCSVSYDVESLFTSIPAKETINYIVDRTYVKKKLSLCVKNQYLRKFCLSFVKQKGVYFQLLENY